MFKGELVIHMHCHGPTGTGSPLTLVYALSSSSVLWPHHLLALPCTRQACCYVRDFAVAVPSAWMLFFLLFMASSLWPSSIITSLKYSDSMSKIFPSLPKPHFLIILLVPFLGVCILYSYSLHSFNVLDSLLPLSVGRGFICFLPSSISTYCLTHDDDDDKQNACWVNNQMTGGWPILMWLALFLTGWYSISLKNLAKFPEPPWASVFLPLEWGCWKRTGVSKCF